MTRGEILHKTGLKSGGSASRRIEELEESGFIQSVIPLGKNSNDALYRLSDEYTLFYIDWIAGLGKRSPGKGYWLSRQNSPKWKIWTGYSFEGLCLKHTSKLKSGLGIGGVESTESSWRYQPPRNSGEQGAQIDLLIDRKDSAINICEMKFSESPFQISKRYAMDLRRKIDVFREKTETRKDVFLTIVSTFGLVDNAYAKEIIDNSLTIDDLF